MARQLNKRTERGNMLALIGAFSFLILIILLFALGYVRLLGSNAEQKTAIEAAALAGARDISQIVVSTPEFGFVGLSDSAPVATTIPGPADSFPTPVHSINTLIGTARLDYIIGDAMSIPEWKELALVDLTAAKTAGDTLVAALDAAITPTGFGKDKTGATITPYISAENAYTQNQIRMTGSSNYVPGSLRLTMGALEGGSATTIPIPSPAGTDSSLDSTNTSVDGSKTCYKSYVNIPFDGQDFVFAAVGSSIRLVDPKLYRDTLSLPYYHRTILKAEAQTSVNNQGTADNYTLQAAACAQPASVHDPLPAPGALQISFPDGMPTGPDDVNSPGELYTAAGLNGNSVDYFEAQGDYPVDTPPCTINNTPTWPVPSDSTQKATTACKIAVYDWLRRAGTKANVTSVIGMHATPFVAQGPAIPWGGPPLSWPVVPAAAYSPPQPGIPRGICHIYRFESDGVVSIEEKDQTPLPFYVVSDDQVYMESMEVFSNGNAADEFTISGIDLPAPITATGTGNVKFDGTYDLYLRLYCRKPSISSGGKHAGEPLDNDPYVALQPSKLQLSIAQNSGTASIDSLVVSGRGAKPPMPPMPAMPPMGTVPTGPHHGAPPKIGGRVDFYQSTQGNVDNTATRYEKFDATGSGPRWTYQRNGTVSDIRFRRVLELWDSNDGVKPTTEIGYVQDK